MENKTVAKVQQHLAYFAVLAAHAAFWGSPGTVDVNYSASWMYDKVLDEVLYCAGTFIDAVREAMDEGNVPCGLTSHDQVVWVGAVQKGDV